ncbi:VWA domain-containing protein [Dongia sp.]|uniref:vWA domain-containing protein n=1 Tax=Dongia sp. TaxID=1977262 RepID=UPI0035B16448
MSADLTLLSDGAGPLARRQMSHFLRVLRDHGFRIGPTELGDALTALAHGAGERVLLWRQTLRALCCRNQKQWAAFDEIFDAFWLRRSVKTLLRQRNLPVPSKAPTVTQPGKAGSHRAGLSVDSWRSQTGIEESGSPSEMRTEGASAAAATTKTDFKDIADPAALRAAEDVAVELAAALRARRTRRFRSSHHGRVDIRRTIRRSIARGGVPLDLVRRQRREEPMRIVALLDASGSMEPYMRAFARFLRGLVLKSRIADAYLFHTHLVHVSPALREPDPQRAIDRLVLMAQGLGGGTLIGESLATFNRHHAKSALSGRACVIILSDGFDAGAPDLLTAELATLKRRCRRLVWLNPLLGSPDYRPEARGMRAALPFIDLLASAHNLDSLAALAPKLARL